MSEALTDVKVEQQSSLLALKLWNLSLYLGSEGMNRFEYCESPPILQQKHAGHKCGIWLEMPVSTTLGTISA